MTHCTALPTRRQRLRIFVALKFECRNLRAAVAGLALLVAFLAFLVLRPEPVEAVPIGRGVAGVAPQLAAPPPPALERTPSAPSAPESHLGSGDASYYGESFNGSRTASGERFDPRRFTAAHRTLPFGSRVRVTHDRTGQSIVVRINDRGPFHANRAIDLSEAAAKRLGMLAAGTARVRMALIH